MAKASGSGEVQVQVHLNVLEAEEHIFLLLFVISIPFVSGTLSLYYRGGDKDLAVQYSCILPTIARQK